MEKTREFHFSDVFACKLKIQAAKGTVIMQFAFYFPQVALDCSRLINETPYSRLQINVRTIIIVQTISACLVWALNYDLKPFIEFLSWFVDKFNTSVGSLKILKMNLYWWGILHLQSRRTKTWWLFILSEQLNSPLQQVNYQLFSSKTVAQNL